MIKFEKQACSATILRYKHAPLKSYVLKMAYNKAFSTPKFPLLGIYLSWKLQLNFDFISARNYGTKSKFCLTKLLVELDK